jgi:hypothetical protein
MYACTVEAGVLDDVEDLDPPHPARAAATSSTPARVRGVRKLTTPTYLGARRRAHS